MADKNQAIWWSTTGRLAAVVLSGFAAVVCIPLVFAGVFDRGTLLGLPTGTLLIALVAPCVVAMAIFWFADRQRALDHRYDVIED